MFLKRSKWIFAVVYLAYTSVYIARVNLSMAGPELIALDVLDTVQLGALGSVFSTVFAVGRLLNGSFSDRTPPWKMLTVGLGLVGISNIAVSAFPPFLGIFLLWTVNAYAQSMLWSSVLCVVAKLYDKSIAKKKTSLMVTSVAAGNVLGIVINTALITGLGTAYAFAVPGALTLILGALVLFGTRGIEAEESVKGSHRSMLQLLREKQLLLMSLPAFFHGVMKDNITLWMTVFVVDTYRVDLSASAYYILLIPVVGLVGRMLYPAVYKLCRENEHTVSLLSFAVCVVCALLLCVGRLHIVAAVLALSLIYAAVSMINTSLLSIYPLQYVKSGNVASVSGIMDFSTYLGAGISGAIYGVVIKHAGHLPMFVSWLVISVLSMVLLLKLRKNQADRL